MVEVWWGEGVRGSGRVGRCSSKNESTSSGSQTILALRLLVVSALTITRLSVRWF